MTSTRYGMRAEKETSSTLYRKKLEGRGLKKINHFCAPKFTVLADELVANIDVDMEYWSLSSKFYKLASKYYGDPTLWWVIAFFNKKPTDFHATLGEMIFIPRQWETVYNAVVEGDSRYEV